MTDYQGLLATLVEKSGLSALELESKLRDKIESLGHLVNEDVALRLVAKDLNISLVNGEMKKPCVQVVDLVPGMNNINLELIIESTGAVKEFSKKDGTWGKILRVVASDVSGRASLVAWDEQTSIVEPLTVGAKIFVHSAYTKSGLNGGVELHLGRRSRLDIISTPQYSVTPKSNDKREGLIWRASNLVFFNRKDGSPGALYSFLIKNNDGLTRVLLWNPPTERLADLKEGKYVEIFNGSVKNDLSGKPELHVNNIDSIRVRQGETVNVEHQLKRLSEIEPNMADIDIEAIVENVFEMSTTQNGKPYLRLLLRQGETVLPLTLWNDKAVEYEEKIQIGSNVKIQSGFSKLGPQGLEIGVNRWSKLLIE